MGFGEWGVEGGVNGEWRVGRGKGGDISLYISTAEENNKSLEY